MDRILKEKCDQLDHIVNNLHKNGPDIKNMSFDEGEALMSLIRKKNDESSIAEFSEVNKIFTNNLNSKNHTIVISSGQNHPEQTVKPNFSNPSLGNSYANPPSNQPYVPDVVMKNPNESQPNFNKTVFKIDNTISTVPPQSNPVQLNNYTQPQSSESLNKKPDKNSFETLLIGTIKEDSHDNSSSNEMYSSGIKVKKSTLKESLGNIGIEDNSLLEYFIDEKGFLIDQNSQPILDDSGRQIQLTEDNIKYLKKENLYEEDN